jgi:AbrB family looped-hinge helix DNA binding protein
MLESIMDVATISANGQITVPADVRKRLQLGPGDKIVFVENEDGDIVVVRPAAAALLEAQRAFRGAVQDAGLESEEQSDEFVAEVRSGRGGRMPA